MRIDNDSSYLSFFVRGKSEMDEKNNRIQEYNHFISLGYFCSVALELERIGLRSYSSPFDWIITDLEGVLNAIENNFTDFLRYDLLKQCEDNKTHYYNEKYKCSFFHDFVSTRKPLLLQLPSVKRKYKRRITRFYNNIVEPTLFLRYISDEIKTSEGKSAELLWIEENYNRLLTILKGFNPANNIIFIANTGVESKNIKIYNVNPDENDIVARKPLEKNKELYDLLNDFYFEKREDNLKYYNEKNNLSK